MSQRTPGHRKAPGKGQGGSKVQRWLKGLNRNQRIGVVAGVVGVVAVVGIGLGVALSGGTTKAGGGGHHSGTSTSTTTTPPPPRLASKTCPLTGLPAPHGKVPRRPVLAVKIGNDPSSRPQSGLDQADIVYEEQAEGGITRYMVVFQCKNAPLVGPTRSVRWDDWNILQQYKHAILAYSGGIQPWTAEAASLPWIYNANGSIEPTANAFYRYNSSVLPASLGAPYNYYTSTAALWGLYPKAKTPPRPIFRFSKRIPAGATRLASASIPFSGASDVVWQWNQATRQWLRFYGTSPDNDPAGHQFHTTNVVIQITRWRFGPYNESYGTSPDVESITTGTGTLYVLRGGKVEKGIWSRPGGADITKFSFPDGKPITLQPGQTWYEVVPNNVTVTLTK
jgi:hypothetical protein